MLFNSLQSNGGSARMCIFGVYQFELFCAYRFLFCFFFFLLSSFRLLGYKSALLMSEMGFEPLAGVEGDAGSRYVRFY